MFDDMTRTLEYRALAKIKLLEFRHAVLQEAVYALFQSYPQAQIDGLPVREGTNKKVQDLTKKEIEKLEAGSKYDQKLGKMLAEVLKEAELDSAL